ncbi:hypothetical protein JHD49_08690 [Sulfurimonas sp. SAG-AH-194-C21]|nr:hypothetical protein [Sulfurimonas sp. SAG-AH-194-C21]MDF1884013.1 hypothetical protein [Sulfurimonas sp. SAG-AH-194-C21]
MTKYITSLIVAVALGFTACGGGESGNVDSRTSYDLWNYITSSTNQVKSLDKYEADSSYSIIGGTEINRATLTYTILAPTRVEETINDTTSNSSQTIIYSTVDDKISVEGSDTSIPRYQKIGDTINNCTFISHFDAYSPYNGYKYSDVIQIKCDNDYSVFYAKGEGKVDYQGHNQYTGIDDVTTHYYYIMLTR